jgi:hypothetical protein
LLYSRVYGGGTGEHADRRRLDRRSGERQRYDGLCEHARPSVQAIAARGALVGNQGRTSKYFRDHLADIARGTGIQGVPLSFSRTRLS